MSTEAELRACASGLLSGEETSRALLGALSRWEDPLGEALCQLRSPRERRSLGAVYTPRLLVRAMIERAAALVSEPARVVDPGCGSARFLVEAGRRFPAAELLGVEIDPTAALLARAHLSALGMGHRAQILEEDYRSVRLGPTHGPTLFLGNPPYVRHHDIGPSWKRWLTRVAARYGMRASQLSGLHVHFWLATAQLARPGDAGVWVTSAEWLDTGYGQLARALLCGPLGLSGLELFERSQSLFTDADTTSLITSFRVGTATPHVPLSQLRTCRESAEGIEARQTAHLKREDLSACRRWSTLFHPRLAHRPSGWVELGEVCRVHRGQATGANDTWVVDAKDSRLPDRFLFSTVTRARELFEAGRVLTSGVRLRAVLDLPVDWDHTEGLTDTERAQVHAFIARARERGAHQGFLARHRPAWWSVRLRPAAPILATYMARQPPAFVLNRARARHLNIAHGLYPLEPLSDDILGALVDHLRRTSSLSGGRTYAGGLAKFEPKDMERIWVPRPEQLIAEGQSAPGRARQ